MRGHLTERRPGVWRLVISNGFDSDGRRRQIIRTVHGSKRDAQRELTKMLRERDEGRLADGRQPLARYLSEEWLPAVTAVSKREADRWHRPRPSGIGTPRDTSPG